MTPITANSNRRKDYSRSSRANRDESDTALIRSQLDKILRSNAFALSSRMQRFLRYTVEQTLAGRSESLNERSIARNCFDKDESHDPRFDPIVRVEAGRLRNKLRIYYDEEGKEDRVMIIFRKRSYIPSFKFPDSENIPVPSIPRKENPLAIAILPFTNLNPGAHQDCFCAGLTEELTNRASRIPQLKVVARTSAGSYRKKLLDIRRIGKDLDADVVLEGSVQRKRRKVRISVALVDVRSGYRLLTKSYDLQMNNGFDAQETIALKIANSLNDDLLQNYPLRQPELSR